MQLPESRLGDVPPPVTDGTLAQRDLQVSLLVAELPPSWRMQLSMHCIRSAAADAGLQAGDVITSVDGRSVEDSASLRRRLSAAAPGEEVSIGVTRAGRELELTATLAEDPGRWRRPGIFKDDGRPI